MLTFKQLFSGATCGTLLASFAFAQAGDGRIVIKVGRVITQAGADIKNGVIVIENGRITEVGADKQGAWDIEVLEQPDLVAFPGYVEAHGSRGMDRPNENIEVAPFLDVRDSIDPINFYFEDSLRQGIVAINVQQGNGCVVGGQGRVVRPFGMTIEDMTVKPDSGLKLVAGSRMGRSRATQAMMLRKSFADVERYLAKLMQDEKDGKDAAKREALFQGRDPEKPENKEGRAMEGVAKWKLSGFEIVGRGLVDKKQEPMLRLVEGKLMAFVWCDGAASVHLALEVARDNGFLANTVLVLEGDSFKAVDAIAEAGVSVVLPAAMTYVERDPATGKEIETFVPAVFAKKKVRYALQSLNTTSQSLWFQAATCVAYGVERETALASVTSTAADILRLGKRVGRLAPGCDGNVVLMSGDPLSATSRVEYVVLDGNVVYDRSKDMRAKHLLEGVEQPGAAQQGLPDEEVDPHSGQKKTPSAKNGKTEKKD